MKKLRFYLNKKLDERMAEEFLDEHGGGIDFGERIVKIHPQLKSVKSLKNIKQREKAIRVYFDNYYRTHRAVIHRNIERLRHAWYKREKEYSVITENFFGGFRFPKGKYIAYVSILNCNPRFLDSKMFQFFYKKPIADAIHTISHELLHFIFFDFIEQRLKKEIKMLLPDQLWNLSEIFNVIVLRSPRYRRIINKHFVRPYPSHRQYIRQFENAYRNSRDAEDFIQRGITIVKTKK